MSCCCSELNLLVSEIAVLFVSGSSGNTSEFIIASFKEILFNVFIVKNNLCSHGTNKIENGDRALEMYPISSVGTSQVGV
jgi:hypothetical protein